MPIGVPRIIYCWGEELPAQWTDIYNFIFRRRMVFLMQYLDDELCNQICGLLINIHMEDRSKELEKKEMERSGVFKNSTQTKKTSASSSLASQSEEKNGSTSFYNKKSRSMEDLLNADEDLGIDDIDTLEQYTLQKITTEWLNWNAQFFDYSDEPYLFYLAELLKKDFNKSQNSVSTYSSTNQENMSSDISQLLNMLKGSSEGNLNKGSHSAYSKKGGVSSPQNKANMQMGEVYAPFRTNTNFSRSDFSSLESMRRGEFTNKTGGKTVMSSNRENTKKEKLLQMFQNYQNPNPLKKAAKTEKTIYNLLSNLAQKDFSLKTPEEKYFPVAPDIHLKGQQEKILGQKNLRRSFSLENNLISFAPEMGSFSNLGTSKSFSYLNSGDKQAGNSQSEFRDYYRKQTERALIEEESKKVFVIINSFGGSVGNGVTVHDALQFIKAGSLTLALGVAASAASLALAGGTIGERYVTEGCHVMIHQPESGLQGQASDIWIDSQEIMKIRLDVAEIYSLSTYRPRHKILRDLDRDFYLTATETIQYGLADEIATNDVMHSIIEMTNTVWDYHDSKQQRLLESRESASSGLDTQTQN
uniref:proteolytic subunit 2 of clp protease n=1 Tax=Chlorococcum tatrense TaxID=915274 RepID=UPI0010C52110|nr:proteolytic subunit 2 of clp protease [Chlorococcum tatrense]AYQ94362.1 proteolytic subunit 2 of clp protease [Chlorococcum tatrense]